METLRTVLAGVTVVDLGTGMAPALVARFLADAGATITRFETARDPFSDIYPANGVWRRGVDVNVVAGASDGAVVQALAKADICICGGEDHPELEWRVDAKALLADHPQLVILDLSGAVGAAQGEGPAVELLAQARSGIAYEHYSDRPLCYGFQAATYGAVLQGLVGVLAALYARHRGAPGQIVSTSLYEGALTWALSYWHQASQPSGSFLFQMPKDPHPLIFRCRDGKYIHFVLGSFGSKGRLYPILEIDDPTVSPDDSGMPTPAAGAKNFFGDVDVLAEHVARQDSGPLLEKIWAAEIAAERVLEPGGCWSDPQVVHNGVVGRTAEGVGHVDFPVRGELTAAAGKGPSPLGTGQPPLAGLRVLDFGLFVAGPYGCVPLADLGADVIKVESLAKDPNRNVYRSFGAVNRGKRAIAVDMKQAEGREIIARLCATAAAMHNNFRPGVSARLGLDAASLHRINPSAVVLESTGYGSDGPKGDRPGFDMIFQAFCGHEARGGGEGNPPLWNRSSMVDYVGGLFNSIATLLGLIHAEKGGGANLQTNLLGAGVYLFSELIQQADGSFAGAPPLNHQQTGFHPGEAFYEAKDGWVAIAARGDAMAGRLSDALTLPSLRTKPRDRWGDAEAAAIAGAVRQLTAEELLTRLKAADVWADLCLKGGDRMLTDPALEGMVYKARHAVYGDVRAIGPLVRLSGSAHAAPASIPELGQDTRAILTELGYGAAAIDDLYARRIVA